MRLIQLNFEKILFHLDNWIIEVYIFFFYLAASNLLLLYLFVLLFFIFSRPNLHWLKNTGEQMAFLTSKPTFLVSVNMLQRFHINLAIVSWAVKSAILVGFRLKRRSRKYEVQILRNVRYWVGFTIGLFQKVLPRLWKRRRNGRMYKIFFDKI